MAAVSERESVALQELLKATQGRCKDLEQQIYVQQKSGEDARAALQRACEQQLESVRKTVSRQSDILRRCKESAPSVLTAAIQEAIETALSKWVKHSQTTAHYEGLKEALQQLLQSVFTTSHNGDKDAVAGPVLEGTFATNSAPILKDAKTRVKQELCSHLTGLVEQCVEHVLQLTPAPTTGRAADGTGPVAASRHQDSSTDQGLECTKLRDAQAEVQKVKQLLQKCQDRMHQQEHVHSTEVKELQTRIDKLTQQLRQAEATQPSQQESVQPPEAVTSMVAMMEQSLGKLSAAVRSKDAEIASLQLAMHEQFTERNELRAQVSGLDSQLLRLQGSYAELEARLQLSEEVQARLQASQHRALNTEDRVQKRFRSRRLPVATSMQCTSTTGASTSSKTSTKSSSPGHASRMHALRTYPSASSSSHASAGYLQELQGGPTKMQSGRFRKVQEHSSVKQPKATRKDDAATTAMLQKHALSRNTWLQGSLHGKGTISSKLKGSLHRGNMPTDLVQFQWESGSSRRVSHS